MRVNIIRRPQPRRQIDSSVTPQEVKNKIYVENHQFQMGIPGYCMQCLIEQIEKQSQWNKKK
jgi:hypothetical protein